MKEVKGNNDTNQIDLIQAIKSVWNSRRTVYKTTLIFLVLGLIVAFGTKVEYEASCKILPNDEEDQMPNLGNLSSLAGLAGINLNFGNVSGITGDLYPQLVLSLPFQLEIIHENLTFVKEDTTTSSYNYFKNIYKPSLLGFLREYTIGLPRKLNKLFSKKDNRINALAKNENFIIINKEDNWLFKTFSKRIDVDVDSKTGIITISAEMPDPNAAAELANNCKNLLQQFVINYKITKANEYLKFIKGRYDDAKYEFEQNQEKLASFNDRNQNVITARAQAEQQRIQNEYNLAFGLYQELASQLEQAEIKVKENTPVFSVIEPVQLPVLKSEPKRLVILCISIFLGISFGAGLIIIKDYFFPTQEQHSL